MELYIQDLQEIQNELDKRIFQLHNTSREKTRNDRILALLVETGELANETRCFKYWSLKGPSEDSVVFEEFSDVLHFTLSLGIDIGYHEKHVHYAVSSKTLNDQFHDIYQYIQAFKVSNEVADYQRIFASILSLAQALGMDEAAIRKMYLDKNEKNHERQDNKY